MLTVYPLRQRTLFMEGMMPLTGHRIRNVRSNSALTVTGTFKMNQVLRRWFKKMGAY